MRFQIGQFRRTGACFISVGPANRYPLYRNFLFDSEGELMIFNSLGRGRPSEDTGARNYLFPVKSKELAFELDSQNEYIRIRNTDGRVWVFDARSSKIESIQRMRFLEDPVINRTNKGGVELTPTSPGAFIDEGWRLGGPPNTAINRKSIIKDSLGNKCRVSNKSLFKLDIDNGGSVDGAIFIHNSSLKWRTFLKNHCPQIEL